MDYFDPQPTGEPWYPIPPDPQDDDEPDPDVYGPGMADDDE